MKRLLTLFFAILSLQLAAQTQSTLPSGSVPYGSVYLAPDGSVWAGAAGKTFKKIGLQANLTALNDSITNLRTSINGKVDKIPGKGLSTEDYTTAEKSKLAGIADGAEVNVNADWLAVSGDAQILNKPTFVATESDPVFLAQKGAANGVATLNSSGKVPNAQIPALALVDTYVAASQAAMLALSTAEQGDVAIRTDLSKTFILIDANYSTLASWKELLSPVIPAETDPIWGASPSAGITATDISHWNTAYGWGNHAGVYLPLTGGTLTGPLTGTSANFTANLNTNTKLQIAAWDAMSFLSNRLTIGGITTSQWSEVGLYVNGSQKVNLTASTLTVDASLTGTTAYFTGNISAAGYVVLGLDGTYGPTYTGISFHGSTSGGVNGENRIFASRNGTDGIYIAAATGRSIVFRPGGSSADQVTIDAAGGLQWHAYSGSGARILYANSIGQMGAMAIGSGLSFSGGTLSATGGASGTVTGTGTSGYLAKWNSASDIGNSIMSESGGIISVAGGITSTGAANFSSSVTGGAASFTSGAFSGNILVQTSTGTGIGAGVWVNHASTSGFVAKIGDVNKAYFYTSSSNAIIESVSGNGIQLVAGGVVGGTMASGGAMTFNYSVAASSFSGAATGLTGTASSLTAGAIVSQANSATITASSLATANTLAQRDASGYLKAVYFYDDNTSIGTSGITSIYGGTGDKYIYKFTSAAVQSFLGLGSAAYTASSAYYSAGSTVANSTLWDSRSYVGLILTPNNLITSDGSNFGYSTTAAIRTLLSVPTHTSHLTNDSGFITSSNGVLAKGNLLITGDGSTTVFNTGLSGGTVMVVSPSSVDAIGLTYYLYQSSGIWYISFATAPANATTVRFYAIVS